MRIAFSVEESKHAGLALDGVFADFYGRWYLELVLKAISVIGSDGPVEVDVIELRCKAMPGCQRNVADSSTLCWRHDSTLPYATNAGQ